MPIKKPTEKSRLKIDLTETRSCAEYQLRPSVCHARIITDIDQRFSHPFFWTIFKRISHFTKWIKANNLPSPGAHPSSQKKLSHNHVSFKLLICCIFFRYMLLTWRGCGTRRGRGRTRRAGRYTSIHLSIYQYIYIYFFFFICLYIYIPILSAYILTVRIV